LAFRLAKRDEAGFKLETATVKPAESEKSGEGMGYGPLAPQPKA
jgi:hypothetical protein